MKVVRAQVTITSVTGMPADNVMNTYHFRSNDALVVDESALDEITQALDDFYTGFEGRIPSTLVASPSTVEFFDLSDPTPRLPIYQQTFAWTPGNGLTALPSEVCVCVSWTAPVESGVSPQSRRGRNFIGPLATNAIETVSGRVKFTAAALTAWSGAADTLATFASATDGYQLAVYSPTLDQSTSLEFATAVVNGGYIDDAPDTQRRRGTEATTRTIFAG